MRFAETHVLPFSFSLTHLLAAEDDDCVKVGITLSWLCLPLTRAERVETIRTKGPVLKYPVLNKSLVNLLFDFVALF